MILLTRKGRRGSNATAEETHSVVCDKQLTNIQLTSTDTEMPTATQTPEQINVPSPSDIDQMPISALVKRRN